MKTVMIVIFLLAALLVILLLIMTRPKRQKSAIKIDDIKTILMQVEAGEADWDFIGIISSAVDCLYFVPKNGRYNLEFEAMTSDQVPYIDRLGTFCRSNNIKFTVDTYGNKPHYPSNEPAPVIRMQFNASMNSIINIAKQIQREVFNNNDDTVYEIVP